MGQGRNRDRRDEGRTCEEPGMRIWAENDEGTRTRHRFVTGFQLG